MIRVLFVTDNLFRRYGITSFMLNYLRHIDKKEISIDFLAWDGNEQEVEKEIVDLGSKIFYMPRLGLRNIFSVVRKLEDFFKLNGKYYDVVHSHFCQMDSLIFPIAKKNGVKVCISHSHSIKFSDYYFRSLRNRIMCVPVPYLADYWCACSVSAGRLLFGEKFNKNSRSIIVPNAIDYDKFTYNKTIRNQVREFYNVGDKFVFGNVGSMKPLKNQLFMIDVFKAVLDYYPDAMLMIVGDGQLKPAILKRINGYGLEECVALIGSTDKPELYYNAFDCYLFPSLYEGFGLSLLEAEINGLTCLCSNTIPCEAIISDNVIQLDKNDSNAWTNACIEIINRRPERCFEVSSIYDIKNSAKFLTKFYKEIL